MALEKMRPAAHLRNGPRKLAWGVAYRVPKTPTDVLLYRGVHQGLYVGVGDRAAGDGRGADAGREPEEVRVGLLALANPLAADDAAGRVELEDVLVRVGLGEVVDVRGHVPVGFRRL